MIELDKRRYDSDVMEIVGDQVDSDYILHEGLRVIPVMGPEDDETPPVIVRVHAPYTQRLSTFKMGRSAGPPLIPSPGDTLLGDTYLGGNIKVAAPVQNSNGFLVYKVSGAYNFVTAGELRQTGRIRFDAHSYASNIDFLGHFNINPLATSPTDYGKVWQSPYFDLNMLASARILG